MGVEGKKRERTKKIKIELDDCSMSSTGVRIKRRKHIFFGGQLTSWFGIVSSLVAGFKTSRRLYCRKRRVGFGTMFSLISGFAEQFFSKREAQILILGLDNAGKTTTLEQLKAIYKKTNPLPFDKIPPTIGLNLGKMDIENCKAIFWDIGGQASFRVIWDKYYSEAHGLLFVVDSSDEQRLDEAKATVEGLVRHTDLKGIPILVMANKQDIDSACTEDVIRDIFDIDNVARSRPCHVQLCSAYTREGLEDGISWLINKIKLVER